MSQTLTGCVNWPAGTITFDEPDNCIGTVGLGCVNWPAGTISVVISGSGNCDDTYVGCVNWTTKRFQIIVPDNCCIIFSEWDCGSCEEGKTPQYLMITFNDLVDCSDCRICGNKGYIVSGVAAALNGETFIVENSSGGPCWWAVYEQEGSFGSGVMYDDLFCEVGGTEYEYTLINIDVRAWPDDYIALSCNIHNSEDYAPGLFDGADIRSSGCMNGVVTNDYAICPGATNCHGTNCIHSGTATVVEGGSP